MPIKFNCPACAAAIKAPETHAGQTLPCPKCGHQLMVPVAPQMAPTPAADEPPEFPGANAPVEEVELPEIVTKRADAPPPAPNLTLSSADAGVEAAPNAFAAPQTVARSTQSINSSNVRIVDIDVPFWSVFKIAFKAYAAVLLLSLVAGAIFLVFSILLALLGIMV